MDEEDREITETKIEFILNIKFNWPKAGGRIGSVSVLGPGGWYEPYHFTKVLAEDAEPGTEPLWLFENYYYSSKEKLMERIVSWVRFEWRLTR